MGLGQTLLTIMALMLLGRMILSMNTTTLDAGFTKDMSEYRITATSLGTSLLESANSLAFDEATVDTFLLSTQVSSLTAAASLGADAGETDYTLFDDIDDYNGYTRVEKTPDSVEFDLSATVQYLSATTSSLTVTTSKTFNKLLTVYVTSPFIVDYTRFDAYGNPVRDTITFRTIYSYWYFR